MQKTAMALSVAMMLTGCAALPGGLSAQAKLAPTQGSSANGLVTFAQRGDKVIVTAEVMGLTEGLHGFHVHEKSDCSAPDGSSAGGHFNPTGQPHGASGSAAHHAGDLPMLYAGADGRARLHAELSAVTLAEGASNIVGRALIVHQQSDDFKTQPTGNSGARVACGVIEAK